MLKNTYLLNVLKVILPITVLVFVYVEGKKQFYNIDFELVTSKIQDIGIFSFFYILFLGCFAVSSMYFYDVYITKKLSIKPNQLFGKSFSFNTYANFLGFGGFAGVGLRSFFYQKGMEKKKLLKWVTVILPYMIIFPSIIAWFVLWSEWKNPIIIESYPFMKIPLLIMCLYGPFVLFLGSFSFQLKIREQLNLIGVSFIEWILAFILFLQVAYMLGIDVNIYYLFILYFFAVVVGLLSTVPGGVGAFDFILLFGLASLQVTEEKIVALLLLYRIVYYVVPFIISTFLLVFFIQKENMWSRIIPNKQTLSFLSHRISTFGVLIVGVLLLLFPVVPTIIYRLRWANEILSMQMMQVSLQISIAIGITLLFLARSIYDQTKRAYYFTLFVLVVGAFLSLSKGFHIGDFILLLIALLLLITARSQFYRINTVYTPEKAIIDSIIIGFISLCYVFVGTIQIPYIKKYVPRMLQDLFSLDQQALLNNLTLGIIISIIIVYFGLFWRKKQAGAPLFVVSTEKKRKLFPKKELYFYKDKKGYIYYQKWMDKVIILSPSRLDVETLIVFAKKADQFGYIPILVNVSNDLVTTLNNNDYYFIHRKNTYAFPKMILPIWAKLSIVWLERNMEN
ncbi:MULTISPECIES: lysylphosphatidylglycerol synthase domain-containing protein [Bacillus]|uniref:lysylphosphatidylglycerol synthase domain-containing protein n=1 Tax=Bacillus TaxID=1386 RepID=UPI000BB8684D|nr:MULTISPECIES: lysylphosphatidylglycerol synthase domain-containing protein [Bacillus]